MLPLTHHDHRSLVFRAKTKINDWIRIILADRNSRNLLLFLLLNFSFAFVELFYGIATNSLGKCAHFHCKIFNFDHFNICLIVGIISIEFVVIVYFTGLISDSFHMFFDCTGLMAGLVASVITKWKANDKYSYGYVRAEVLAGFVNSLFLLFISFFILAEAVERAIEPPEVSFFVQI